MGAQHFIVLHVRKEWSWFGTKFVINDNHRDPSFQRTLNQTARSESVLWRKNNTCRMGREPAIQKIQLSFRISFIRKSVPIEPQSASLCRIQSTKMKSLP